MSETPLLRRIIAALLAATLVVGAPVLTATAASAEELASTEQVEQATPEEQGADEASSEEESEDAADDAEAGEEVPEPRVETSDNTTSKTEETSPERGAAEVLAAQEVTGGTLTWGVKDTWRNYVTGPIANGEILAEAPATVNDNLVTWTNGSGSLDPDAGTGTVTYEGAMVSQGHAGHGPDGGFGLDQRLVDPQIELTSTTTATLSAEVTQSPYTAFPEYSGERVELAELTFSESALSSGQIAASGAFTEAGARVYGQANENYQPGAPVDNVNFGINTEAPQPDPTTVTLSATPEAVAVGDEVTLRTTVEPALAGTITFRNGTSVLGDAVETNTGEATYRTSDLPEGTHRLTAQFEPAETGYAGSTSAPVSVVVAKPEDDATVGSLQWGVKDSFRSYVVGPIAQGKITVSNGAKQASGNGIFRYPQADRSKWNGSTGSVQFAGNVNFRGHDGAMDVNLANPIVRVTSASKATVVIPFGKPGDTISLANIDLSSAKKETLADGAVRYSQAKTTLTKSGAERFFVNDTGEGPAGQFYEAGTELDRITFTIGADSDVKIVDPPERGKKPGKKPGGESRPAGSGGTAAGSLRWGISSYFSQYTTRKSGSSCPTPSGHCAGGSISTSGVGSGWLFPQAAGSSWNEKTQTGTVKFSGVVAFKGYGMTMFQVANPTITVTGPNSATLSTGYSGGYGPSSVPLNLGAATKSVGAGGEVTWSNVPVGGGLVGISASQGIGFDALTFTVGEASGVNFGSTEDSGDESEYTPADTPPTTAGLEVLTPADRIKEGGRIQVQAPGFDPEDEGVLVVLYEGDGAKSGPIVLDEEARADENGLVQWSGTLPDEGTGDYVITLQGSTDAGAEIDILEAGTERAPVTQSGVDTQVAQTATMAGALAPAGMGLWEWWASAGGLVVIAACTTLLAMRQRSLMA